MDWKHMVKVLSTDRVLVLREIGQFTLLVALLSGLAQINSLVFTWVGPHARRAAYSWCFSDSFYWYIMSLIDWCSSHIRMDCIHSSTPSGFAAQKVFFLFTWARSRSPAAPKLVTTGQNLQQQRTVNVLWSGRKDTTHRNIFEWD